MRVIDDMSDGSPPVRTCDVTVRAVERWIAENDKLFSMAKLFLYNMVNQEYVAVLNCSVCKCFKDNLHSTRISTQLSLSAGQICEHPCLTIMTHRYTSASDVTPKNVSTISIKTPQRSPPRLIRLCLKPTEMPGRGG